MISALGQQGGPSPLWNGARRSICPGPGRHDNVVPLPESQAKSRWVSKVARPKGSVVDLKQRRLFSF